METFSVALPATVPPLQDTRDIENAINDMYVQMYSLVAQLNRFAGIEKSPDGHYWRIGVDNTGARTATDLGTVLPI